MNEVNVSTFKATCLALLKKVQQTQEPLLVTLRGEPLAEIRPPTVMKSNRKWLGSARDTGAIVGDIVSPTGEAWNVERADT